MGKNFLSDDSIQVLRDLIREERARFPPRLTEYPNRPMDRGSSPIKIGRTGAHTQSYPVTGDYFEVELGELSFDDTSPPGEVGETFNPYVPQVVRKALSFDGSYINSGDIVLLFRNHGRWYIISLGGSGNAGLYRYELTQGWSMGSTSGAIIREADGSAFGNAGIEDPFRLMSDQSVGDVGWCIYMGNTYYAIQAPCDTVVVGDGGIPVIGTGIVQASTFT